MKYINIKNILLVLLIISFSSCGEETICFDNGIVEEFKTDFQLSANSINFTSKEGKSAISISNIMEVPQANIISKNSDWCTIKMSQGKEGDALLDVSVTENTKVSNRTAQIELIHKGEKKYVMIMQSQKIFEHIAEVQNIKAIPKEGAVELTWQDPADDNVRYVIVTVQDKDKQTVFEERVERGVQKILINDLLSSNGNYIFNVQSFDQDREPGKIATIQCAALKKVAFKFNKVPGKQFLPYYLKESEIFTSHLTVGSNEFNEKELITLNFDVDPELLDQYNKDNGTDFKLMPADAFINKPFEYKGIVDYQNLDIEINMSSLEDRTSYGLPIKIVDASGKLIEEEGSSALLLFHVDDLRGWYTLERLPDCGEGQGSYHSKRRYIQRVDTYRWETGYACRTYVNTEDESPSDWQSSNNRLYIDIDPATKHIHIQQGWYGVGEEDNVFDLNKQEFHIRFLYSDWAGFWIDERMYERSFER